MFNIEFICNPITEFGEASVRGRITLGHFTETFVSPLIFWSESDYQNHWMQAAQHLVKERDRTLFLTTMYNPEYADILLSWPMWCIGSQVRVQNQMLLLREHKGQLDPQSPYSHIEDWVELSDNGESLSTWLITMDDIVEFIDRHNQ